MEIHLSAQIFLCAAVFAAGLVDSIAGGGGLITLPAYLLAGLPPHLALGTNKMVSSCGTSVAVFNYIRQKKTSLKIIASGLLFSLLGSFAGSRTILLFSPELAGKIIIFLMPAGVLAVIIPRGKDRSFEDLDWLSYLVKIPLICFSVGFYDGFFGPGTGTFLAMALYIFLKLDLLDATGNARVFNLLSNLGSLSVFLMNGQILFHLALPLIVFGVSGNFIGSHLAIRKGKGLIKAGLFVSMGLLLVTLVIRWVKG